MRLAHAAQPEVPVSRIELTVGGEPPMVAPRRIHQWMTWSDERKHSKWIGWFQSGENKMPIPPKKQKNPPPPKKNTRHSTFRPPFFFWRTYYGFWGIEFGWLARGQGQTSPWTLTGTTMQRQSQKLFLQRSMSLIVGDLAPWNGVLKQMAFLQIVGIFFWRLEIIT